MAKEFLVFWANCPTSLPGKAKDFLKLLAAGFVGMFKETVKNLLLSHFSKQTKEVFSIMSANTSNFWQTKLMPRI